MHLRAHVVEKVTQWHGENDRKLKEPLKLEGWLCVRLGAGNTRRREQLRYWQEHPEQGSGMKMNAEIPLPAPNVYQKLIVDPDTALVGPTPAKSIVHSIPASKFTAQSFSIVAQSVLKDTATISGRPKTTYAASDYRPEATEIRLPDFPKAEKGAVTVPCPYCFAQLNVKEMANQRELWKYVHSFLVLCILITTRKHVFRDLRPYQCTWEHCSHSEKLYVTRHDWIFHETQIHRRQWTCRDCDETFKSKTSIENHMRGQHLGTFTEKQLPVLLNLCERAVEPTEPTECPLCEKILPLASSRGGYDLQSHLAWHLEQIALFVISRSDADETSDAGEAHSNKAALGMIDDAEAAQLPGARKDPADSSIDRTEGGQIPATNAVLGLLKLDEAPTKAQVISQVQNWAIDSALVTEAISQLENLNHEDYALENQNYEGTINGSEGNSPSVDLNQGQQLPESSVREPSDIGDQEKVAGVNAQGEHYSNALRAAASEGHEPVVELFVKSADIEEAFRRGREAYNATLLDHPGRAARLSNSNLGESRDGRFPSQASHSSQQTRNTVGSSGIHRPKKWICTLCNFLSIQGDDAYFRHLDNIHPEDLEAKKFANGDLERWKHGMLNDAYWNGM